MTAHHCHARNCREAVPPKMFMCRRHWYMVPKALRDAVWAAYVPGQENRKDPTSRYLVIAETAISYVAMHEYLQRVKLEDWDKVPEKFRKLAGRDGAPTAKEIVGTMTVIRFLYEVGCLEDRASNKAGGAPEVGAE